MTTNRHEIKGKLVKIVSSHIDDGSIIGIEEPAKFDVSRVTLTEDSGRRLSTGVIGIILPNEYIGRNFRTVVQDKSLPTPENCFRGKAIQEVYINDELVHQQSISYNENAVFSYD
jgi:hypothetical protein